MSTVTIPGLFKRKGIWTYRRVIEDLKPSCERGCPSPSLACSSAWLPTPHREGGQAATKTASSDCAVARQRGRRGAPVGDNSCHGRDYQGSGGATGPPSPVPHRPLELG